ISLARHADALSVRRGGDQPRGQRRDRDAHGQVDDRAMAGAGVRRAFRRVDKHEACVGEPERAREPAMGPQAASQMTLSERADALEEQMMHELDRIITKSVLFISPTARSRWRAGRRYGRSIRANTC